ncbi:MAG: ThuA domain-containing protein [Acidobacteriaceae bacterium]|jgi:type 1 glutamine amidotransferase
MKQQITRRNVLSGIAASALLPAAARASAAKKATAFALIGDRYHNSDYIRTALRKTLVKDLGISIDFRDEVELLNAEELKGYKLLIILRDGMLWPGGYVAGPPGAPTPPITSIVSQPPLAKIETEPFYWITAEQGKAVKAFVTNGGGVLFYHNVTYISPHNDDFRDVLGAVTEQHPPLRPFKVKVVNREHPITRGVNDFVVTDEQHFMAYQKDPKYLLLQSINEDGLTFKDLGTSSAAGWAYDYGKGRVCYLAPGHVITSLWNPEYETLQKNAVRWLLKQT